MSSVLCYILGYARVVLERLSLEVITFFGEGTDQEAIRNCDDTVEQTSGK